MFEIVSGDVFLIAEAVLILLDIITFALMIALIYLAFVGGALYRPDQHGRRGSRATRIGAFALASVITLGVTHWLLQKGWLLAAIVWFVAALSLTFAVYWVFVRAIHRDMRVPYTVMVLGGTCLLAFGTLVLLWVARDRVRLGTETALSINTLLQIATIAVTAISVIFTYILKSDQSNRTARQQIYQTLELQSIELFRFEASNRPLVEALWEAHEPPSSPMDHYQLKQYVCQMLNLFEMAYRFRVEGIIAPSVFGSWVIWIWELGNAPVFRALWTDEKDGLSLNYVPDFRKAVDEAVKGAAGSTESAEKRRKAFFQSLAKLIGCDEVEGWLNEQPLTAS